MTLDNRAAIRACDRDMIRHRARARPAEWRKKGKGLT
jgi:hypothetical protein